MGKRIVILGGGESGVGAAILAKKKGYDVFVSDESSLKDNYRNELKESGIRFEEGYHSENEILSADEVMKSPGIPEKNAMVKRSGKKESGSSAKLNWLIVSKAIARSSLLPAVTAKLLPRRLHFIFVKRLVWIAHW